jgi:diaminohydroxyphosphoribosylaminopyrimidine deaminase/5-amino-6-(5-phosphoribosylamino)uracil reductase
MPPGDDDIKYMRMALREAARGLGRTAPNPMVGCVLVRDGHVLARGWHHKAGLPHAEVDALSHLADHRAPGATCYVTLEPCNHTRRTGPCTEALIAAGVTRVVAAMRDPHTIVDGRGIERLRAAGIHVDVGVLEKEARTLNAGYLSFITRHRPRVTLKAAVTLDGRLAARGGDARWVTGEPARREAHRLRDAADAILVGAGTVRADDPQLTTRLPGRRGKDPLRVILDGHLAIPEGAAVVRPGTLIVTGVSAPAEAEQRLHERGAEVLRLPDAAGHVALAALLDELGRRDVMELLIEGGGQVHAGFLAAGLVDRVIVFVAPKLVGSGGVPLIDLAGPERMAEAWQLRDVVVRRLGDDVMILGQLGDPTSSTTAR